MRIIRLDGSRKRRVYETEFGNWWIQEWPTGRCRAWWEGPKGEQEELGDFPTLEAAYEAIEADFGRRVQVEEDDLDPPF